MCFHFIIAEEALYTEVQHPAWALRGAIEHSPVGCEGVLTWCLQQMRSRLHD